MSKERLDELIESLIYQHNGLKDEDDFYYRSYIGDMIESIIKEINKGFDGKFTIPETVILETSAKNAPVDKVRKTLEEFARNYEPRLESIAPYEVIKIVSTYLEKNINK